MNKKRIEVVEYIEDNEGKIIDFLKDYVSFKSINTGKEGEGIEKEVQDWLADSLNSFGFKVDKWAEDKKNPRPNVVATYEGEGTGRDLILNGHSDVVPEIQDWSRDPWDPEVIDGKVYGRGTSDMKGPNTAAIWALKALKDVGIGLDGNVFLQLVAGEESNEGDTIGTNSAVERGYRAPFAVVMEPTNLEIHVKSSSLFFFKIIIPGKSVHNSSRNQVIFPQPFGVKSGHDVGVDALQKTLPFINLFYRLERDWNQRWSDPVLGGGGYTSHDQQGTGVFTINPALIVGGGYLGAVPGEVEVTYGVWYPPDVDKQTLWDEIKTKVRSLASTDDWLKDHPPEVKVPVLQEWEGFETELDEPGIEVLQKSFNEVTEKNTPISGFKAVCDATYLGTNDIPAVVCGPGSIAYGVHGSDEFIPVRELVEAAKVYATFILNWCS